MRIFRRPPSLRSPIGFLITTVSFAILAIAAAIISTDSATRHASVDGVRAQFVSRIAAERAVSLMRSDPILGLSLAARALEVDDNIDTRRGLVLALHAVEGVER